MILLFLHKPYPLRLEPGYVIKMSLVDSLFVFFFLLVFEPFGINTNESALKYLIMAGVSFICFLMLLFNQLVIPKIYKNTFREENWTILKRILWILWIVVSIAIVNYIFATIVDSYYHLWRLGFDEFTMLLSWTFFVSLLIIFTHTVLNQNYLLRKNLRDVIEITDGLQNKTSTRGARSSQSEKVTLVSENGKERWEYQAEDLLCISSEGNYVQVISIQTQNRNILIRNSLKNIEAQCSAFPFLFRCHRRYMINLLKVEKAIGNAQGIKLSLETFDQAVPVSRSCINKFKKQMALC